MEPEVYIDMDVAETVYVQHPESNYGIFCFNSKGDLFLSSDYGMYGFAWRHYGKGTFRDFLKGLNADYVLGKFEINNRYTNPKGVPKFAQKHLLNLIIAFLNAIKESELIKQIAFNGDLIATLTSQQDWINRVPNSLPKERKAEVRVWLDANNNCLSIGEDFRVAQETASYPVRVYSLQRVAEAAAKEVQS